ncbi:ATP-dependent DNA helicase [Vreelandella venusta]|uniref:ATP-dependent DNA helicase n=1 Tax=Vreelandella venusta TaxID=44935 RepID=UPI00116D5CCF|nr:AAA family ATPase [Halomonas venusta]GEK52392.1 deoxyribonuclease [Halomonas venusta]
MPITLTPDQQAGKARLISFLSNPNEPVMVIEGYSGTGKSTLVNTFLDELPLIIKTVKLINPGFKDFQEVLITATTNKAAEALSNILKQPVRTIYSALGLRLHWCSRTRQDKLIQADIHNTVDNCLILIDEASYMDDVLIDFLFKITRKCKIVLMGDPAQLINRNSQKAPAFTKGYPTVKLTQVVRQDATNQIQALSTMFRNAVNTQYFEQFKPNGVDVIYLNRIDFDDAIVTEFTRPNWKQSESRVLAWTNKKVQKYNAGITQLLKGTSELQPGDYVICNRYINKGKSHIKTDAMVQVASVSPDSVYDTPGHHVTLTGYGCSFFMPASLELKKRALEEAIDTGNTAAVFEIEKEWIDLRPTFASTINKSQGSTYDKVFIDLDDINQCTCAETIARLMYVGVSRARFKVYLTGVLT